MRERGLSLCLRGSDEAVADAENGFDIAGAIGIIPKLPTQAAEVACEGVVPTLGVGPPQRVRDLAIPDHCTSPRGEGVQEDVLARREPNLARPLMNALVKSVNLEIGNSEKSQAALSNDSIAWQRDQHELWMTSSHDEPVIPISRAARDHPAGGSS
jgi:hypothetical protein